MTGQAAMQRGNGARCLAMNVQIHACRCERIVLYDETKHLMATSGLTKENIRTLQKFREEYELLIDDILETAILSKVTKNINGGTTGIVNQVQSAGVNVLYGSSSLSTTFTPAHLLQTIKDLQEQIDKLN
mgnify:CR=1 FL=1